MRELDLPGKLFIVEGIDGSGKSTQLDLLHKWLISEGYLVVATEWNSASIVKQTTRRGKKRRLLTPMSFSLIHSADFASRTYQQILPALRGGAVVLADRYVYTAFARDAVRGVNREWLRDLYSFAVRPSLAFYFDVPLAEAITRIRGGRAQLKYYEAGLDLGLATDPEVSFARFQGLIREEYERLVEEFGLIRMDATQTLIRQQRLMREIVRPHLTDIVKVTTGEVREALASEDLLGRYLEPASRVTL
ncbi:MAG TPA: thymidylate kinase [Actinomycetota bacterium]|jgi:dTMP kinase|nr:thymidylate kinase [Actinomycetota bacterium]